MNKKIMNCFKNANRPKVGSLIRISKKYDMGYDTLWLWKTFSHKDHGNSTKSVNSGTILTYLGNKMNSSEMKFVEIPYFFLFEGNILHSFDPGESFNRYNWEMVETE